MKKIKVYTITTLGFAAALAMGLWVSGCQTAPRGSAMTAATEKGGAQLWADKCARCHHSPSPTAYGDAEWQVAMHHMRVIANLTAEEHHKILVFLKSAN